MKTKEINGFTHVLYQSQLFPDEEMIERSQSNLTWQDQRRSVRDISNKSFPKEVIENIILTASTAPSGAHKQPWTFCLISNPEIKRKIRIAAEEEEKVNYDSRMSESVDFFGFHR